MSAAAGAPRFAPGWRSLTEHALDPHKLHIAARTLGRMVADLRITEADAEETIGVWTAGAPATLRSGVRSRLFNSYAIAVDARARERVGATVAAARAGRPLIERRAPPADILKAARCAADGVSRGLLTDDEIGDALRDEWNRAFGASRHRR